LPRSFHPGGGYPLLVGSQAIGQGNNGPVGGVDVLEGDVVVEVVAVDLLQVGRLSNDVHHHRLLCGKEEKEEGVMEVKESGACRF